jgi:nucleoside-diphosphate-sugar epimerase
LNPTSPYGASKLAADRYCYAYRTTYDVPVATIRPFNTFGPRHTYDVIPKFIDLALRNENIPIYRSGLQERDFMFIEDLVDGFLAMGSHDAAIGRFVNFGTGRSISIVEIAKCIVRLAESQSKVVQESARAAELAKLCCDSSLALALFGWVPKVSLEEGLARNIAWARSRER